MAGKTRASVCKCRSTRSTALAIEELGPDFLTGAPGCETPAAAIACIGIFRLKSLRILFFKKARLAIWNELQVLPDEPAKCPLFDELCG